MPTTRREFLTTTVAAALGAPAVSLLANEPLASEPAPASEPETMDIRSALQSLSSDLFPLAATPGAGFSFTYDGVACGPVFSTEWIPSVRKIPGGVQKVLTHHSGLVVTTSIRIFPEHNAIEYSTHFKNTAANVLPPIAVIRALDLTFDQRAMDRTCVISGGGGTADYVLPPTTFAIHKTAFATTASGGGALILGSEEGVSSDKDMPFFFLHSDGQQQGMFVAFGWSGIWQTLIQETPQNVLRVRGKIPDLSIALNPGEEIQGPTIVIGSYRGPVSAGSNQLRRLIHDVYTPRLGGDIVLPPMTYDHWWGVELHFDEALLMKLADGAASVGQEYFLLDAGWFAGTNDVEDFHAGVGNWEQIDRHKLPNGLKPIADHVRSQGLKFGLWFEPERVHRGSLLARKHPEWILWKRHERDRDFQLNELLAGSNYRYDANAYGLLDYSRPEVQDWVRSLLDRYISDLDIRYLRYDFNLTDPLSFWLAKDPPSRHGISQLRHIQGFYAVIDWIRARHPATLLECCASGGRRIDLETARRFHTFWISDHTADPALIRFQLFGINYFLPGNYHYRCYVLPSGQENSTPDDLGFQSLFGGAFGTGGRVDLWSPQIRQQTRGHVEIYKRLRRYLLCDYYPLSTQPCDTQSWSGWQFHDNKTSSGFVETFRTSTSSDRCRFTLHGLDKGGRYRFSDPYTADSFELGGEAALTDGIEMHQPPMSARVLLYSRA